MSEFPMAIGAGRWLHDPICVERKDGDLSYDPLALSLWGSALCECAGVFMPMR